MVGLHTLHSRGLEKSTGKKILAPCLWMWLVGWGGQVQHSFHFILVKPLETGFGGCLAWAEDAQSTDHDHIHN